MNSGNLRIAIATAAFMLVLIILGYQLLRGGSRPVSTPENIQASQIEIGGEVYNESCASCHGKIGRALTCIDPELGGEIPCSGTAISSGDFYCNYYYGVDIPGGYVARVLESRGDDANEIRSHSFFGDLSQNQKEAIQSYIDNWHFTDEYVNCSPTPVPVNWQEELPLATGDLANGEWLYNVDFGCSACHGTMDGSEPALVGPALDMYRDPNYQPPLEGYTIVDFFVESVLSPHNYMSEDCPYGPCAGPPSAMPDYVRRMTAQGLADVMAYVLDDPGPFELTRDPFQEDQ